MSMGVACGCDLVPVIASILRKYYPKQSLAALRDRAVAYAAKMKGIDAETITTHEGRSRSSGRKLT